VTKATVSPTSEEVQRITICGLSCHIGWSPWGLIGPLPRVSSERCPPFLQVLRHSRFALSGSELLPVEFRAGHDGGTLARSFDLIQGNGGVR